MSETRQWVERFEALRDDLATGDLYYVQKWVQNDGALTEIAEGIARLARELEEARELISDVAASGVAFDDPRLRYVEIQIDRQTWDRVCALAAHLAEAQGEGATTHLIRTAVAVADAAPWRQSPDMDLLKSAVEEYRAATPSPDRGANG